MIHAVIFDGDDTLWLTESLYDEARSAARLVVEAAGFNGERWELLERQMDVANVDRLGHSPQRFPTSCVEAFDALADEVGVTPNPATRDGVRRVAERVFDANAPLRPHAHKVLFELSSRGVKLALLTKGDKSVQERRITRSGLTRFFDVVEVVDNKSPEAILRVVDRLGVDPASVVSVGNSVRSDVLPSIAAGVKAVWIPAHVWEYERAHDHLTPDGVATISELDELLELFGP